MKILTTYLYLNAIAEQVNLEQPASSHLKDQLRVFFWAKLHYYPCPIVRDCHAVCLALFQLLPAFNMPESDVP